MKLFVIAASIVSLLTSCAFRDTGLEGRWRSNKALTVATIDDWKPRSAKPLSPRKRALLASLFGELIVTYHRGTATCEMRSPDGLAPTRTSSRYRIVASDDDSLAYVSKSFVTNRLEITHVYFDGPNRYWIYLHRTSMKEYFDRIAP
ncbi:MAG TPA: hypothetical protein VIT21_02905 [Chthoniobacterales bacterium]